MTGPYCHIAEMCAESGLEETASFSSQNIISFPSGTLGESHLPAVAKATLTGMFHKATPGRLGLRTAGTGRVASQGGWTLGQLALARLPVTGSALGPECEWSVTIFIKLPTRGWEAETLCLPRGSRLLQSASSPLLPSSHPSIAGSKLWPLCLSLCSMASPSFPVDFGMLGSCLLSL